MKKIFLLILLTTPLLQGQSWGAECVGFENMAVKILRQEGSKVYLTWNASVVNKCDKMISTKVQMQVVDKKDKSLGESFQLVNQLLPNETREIKSEKNLPSDIFFQVQGYYFKARELSVSLD